MRSLRPEPNVQTLDAKALRRVRLYFTRKPAEKLRKVKKNRVS
jgi:hypothetical protein